MNRARFTETQIIELAYRISVALEYCHSLEILHQGMKPMNGNSTSTLSDDTFLTQVSFSATGRAMESNIRPHYPRSLCYRLRYSKQRRNDRYHD